MSPYNGSNFFSFFWILLKRMVTWSYPLATDEVQLYVLSGIAISCAFVGTFLMLRKMTMLANALSHTILLGIVGAYLLFTTSLGLTTLMVSSLVMGVITTFLTQAISKLTRLQEDASIGLVFTLLFAIGLFLVTSYTRNLHIGTELLMGNVDALQPRDIRLVFTTLCLNLVLFTLFFRGYLLTTFDSGIAHSFGYSPTLFHYLLMIQAAMTAISAFRSIGVFMVLAFLVVPPMIARLFTKTLKSLLLGGCTAALGTVLLGVALSRHCLTFFGVGLSTGGIVVTLLFFIYLIAAVWKLTFRKPGLYFSS